MEINKQILQTALDRKERKELIKLIENGVTILFRDIDRISSELYKGVTLTESEMFECFPEIHHWQMKHTGWGSVKIHIPVKVVRSFLGIKYTSKLWLIGWSEHSLLNWNFSDVGDQKVGDDNYLSNEQLNEVYNEIKSVRNVITQHYIQHYIQQHDKQKKKAPL